MKILALILSCLPVMAMATDYPQFPDTHIGCSSPEKSDRWELVESDRPGIYNFSYWNLGEKCSTTLNHKIVEAEDGFRVHLFVIANYNGTDKEYIYVVPLDPQYMSFPSELFLSDEDNPGVIQLIPGIS